MSPSIDLDGDAEAVVAPLLPLAHLRVAAGSMKLECGSSVWSMPVDRAVDQAVGFDLLDVLRLDGGQRGGEDPIPLGHRSWVARALRPKKPPTSAETTIANTADRERAT